MKAILVMVGLSILLAACSFGKSSDPAYSVSSEYWKTAVHECRHQGGLRHVSIYKDAEQALKAICVTDKSTERQAVHIVTVADWNLATKACEGRGTVLLLEIFERPHTSKKVVCKGGAVFGLRQFAWSPHGATFCFV